jgi:hypothetical protein
VEANVRRRTFAFVLNTVMSVDLWREAAVLFVFILLLSLSVRILILSLI